MKSFETQSKTKRLMYYAIIVRIEKTTSYDVGGCFKNIILNLILR